jgi:DNA-binding NtrC family response regulator
VMSLERRCVLVVEDEFYLARDLQHVLASAGATVLGPFPRGPAALAALEERRPDCAIIDVNLGAGADFALADALHARAIPFLFYTGYDREVIPPRFAGVARLEKPVDTWRLVDAAAEACRIADGRANVC